MVMTDQGYRYRAMGYVTTLPSCCLLLSSKVSLPSFQAAWVAQHLICFR